MISRRGRIGKRFAAWLGVLGLALHAVLPVGQALPSPWIEDPATGLPLPLVICSATGPRLAMPAEMLSPDAAPYGGRGGSRDLPSRSDHSSCPICQIHALGGALLPPAPVAVPAPSLLALAGRPPTRWEEPETADPPLPLPRGPPSLA